MKVLIVVSRPDLGRLWESHLLRMGAQARLVLTHDAAISAILQVDWDVIVIDMGIERAKSAAGRLFEQAQRSSAEEIGAGHGVIAAPGADPKGSSAIALADFASYRRPDAKVIFVSSSSFFSDGSIFQLSGNAHAFLPSSTPPEDLAAVVEHHARLV